jgi:GST-like protein
MTQLKNRDDFMTPDAFPILKRFPAQHPDRLQLFSVPTPNGVKVSIMLEELGIPYEVHRIPFGEEGTGSAEFRSLSHNGKIPAILDPHGPDGSPLPLFESGAILLYLAEKHGRFLSRNPAERWETIQWLFWQMGGLGPMFGQVGFFNKFAGREYEDKRPLQRYVAESRRLLGVLDDRLKDRDWIAGEYSIADIATIGWVRNLITFYEARDLVEFDGYTNVAAWLERGLARPAVQRGLSIPE